LSQKKDRSSGINKNWSPSLMESQTRNITYYIEGLKKCDLKILSEALTLIENQNTPFDFSMDLLQQAAALQKPSIRIGISGSPGVGKSTFINALGSHLLDRNKKLAVLAVDPSSELTKGSILGDKTRMGDLAIHALAYVRPSPSKAKLGGTAPFTKEAITLCEAAGFEIILIETVGVGQSETAVRQMVDVFCLLLLPGAGDDLQGIKKGIVELSDVFIINKADKERKALAEKSKRFYKEALHLQHAKSDSIVSSCSSLNSDDMPRIWEIIAQFITTQKLNDTFQNKRVKQDQLWLTQKKKDLILSEFYSAISNTNQDQSIFSQAQAIYNQIKNLGSKL